MPVSEKFRSSWSRQLFRLGAVAGWVAFVSLLPHQSVSPEFFGRYSSEYMLFLSLILAAVMALTILAFFRLPRPAFVTTMNLGGKISLLLLSTIVTLIATEVFVRAVDFLGVSLFEEVTKYVLELEADEELVYKHRAGLDRVYQNVSFRTNALGLRDNPVPEPDSDGFRILVLGDSVTVGWGVAVEDTFSEQLEGLLTKRLERPVHVINSGVSGYNTQQELTFLKRHISTMAPDLVILVYVENDVEPKAVNMVDMQYRWENPPNANATLLRWSWLYRLIYYLGPDLLGSAKLPTTNDGWQQSMEALAEAHEVSTQYQAGFVTYLYRMLADDLTDSLQQDISRVAEAGQFRFVDTLPWFEKSQFSSLINSFVDTHPNAMGHRIIAEGIARDLLENGMLCQTSTDGCRETSQQ